MRGGLAPDAFAILVRSRKGGVLYAVVRRTNAFGTVFLLQRFDAKDLSRVQTLEAHAGPGYTASHAFGVPITEPRSGNPLTVAAGRAHDCAGVSER